MNILPVTKTTLPILKHYAVYLEKIWRNGWVTNNGELVKELTRKLRARLAVPHMVMVANGTLALQLAIKALKLKGEIITTPFSYVATTTAILWEGCQPVFVDIEARTFCIDADKIEAAITKRTAGILATHVYGYPCAVKKIERIARKHKLKVIYDAAHAFGVQWDHKPLLSYGDVSALSFHATKQFHTAEGGAVVCRDAKIAERIALIKKFGHIGEDHYFEAGINAKMSELHAAMGLCVLPKLSEIITTHRRLSGLYDRLLDGSGLVRPQAPENTAYNYAYYPVVFPSHSAMMRTRQALIKKGIMPRRYFFPSLNTLPYLKPGQKRACPVSEDISSRILCLPLYLGLKKKEVELACRVIRLALQGKK